MASPIDTDLSTVTTVVEFAIGLRRLYVRAGKRSYRQLEAWAAEQRKTGRRDVHLNKSSMSEALNGKRLPRKEFVGWFAEACGIDEKQRAHLLAAWERVAEHHHVLAPQPKQSPLRVQPPPPSATRASHSAASGRADSASSMASAAGDQTPAAAEPDSRGTGPGARKTASSEPVGQPAQPMHIRAGEPLTGHDRAASSVDLAPDGRLQPYGGSSDAPRSRRPLSIKEKAELQAAVSDMEIMADPGKRKALLRELAQEYGTVFHPSRFAKADSWEIVRFCLELDAMDDLVDALGLLGGETQSWQRLATVVARLTPRTVLRVPERRYIEQLLQEAPPDLVQHSAAAAGSAARFDLGIAPTDDPAAILDRLDWEGGHQGDARPLWVFLEAAAHMADPLLGEQLHRAINRAADVHGDETYVLVQQICAEQVSRADGVLPPQNPFFTGREDTLLALKRTLDPNAPTALLPLTLHGLGGVGKSQAAIEFAYRYRSDYDLVWWIPADDDRSIRRSIVSLARRLGLHEGDDQQSIKSALDELRVGTRNPRWLVVFDNATEPEIARPYLPTGNGNILITSRSRSWVGLSVVIEVDSFQPEESVTFLAARWEDLSDADALALAERLGHLPLALDQAATFHRQTGISSAEYVRFFDANPAKTLEDSDPSDYPLSVAKTWRRAFEQLRTHSPAAAQLIQLCAVLGPHPIPVAILRAGRGAKLPSPLDATLRDELQIRLAIQEIGKHALAQLDTGRDLITIHKLVRTVLRDSLEPEQLEQMQRSAQELLGLANPSRQ